MVQATKIIARETQAEVIKNYVNGEWVASKSTKTLDVVNPATTEVLARVPMSTREEVEETIRYAQAAYDEWRETPPLTRARYMFTLKNLMEEHFEEVSQILTKEHGKTIDESRGEVRRAIECVEHAAGIPTLMMGYNLETIAPGLDEECILQPLGIFACLPPSNFPAMIPWWFLPYAVACGNTYVLKPSSEVPLTQNKLFELVDEAGFPPGVINLVNGSRDVSDALLESKDVKGVSFVGSTPVAKYVYGKATAGGKRAQCQGGAKNFLLVMPDAPLDKIMPAVMNSVYGCAGQRCLAGANVVAVGDDAFYQQLKKKLLEAAKAVKTGYGLDETVQMGPLRSAQAKEKVLSYIETGIKERAELILDGRNIKVPGYEKGYFIGPTIFDKVNPKSKIGSEEIFGPVMCLIRAKDFEEALRIIHENPYGNAASIFTQNGKWARDFKHRVLAGDVGVNIGIAAPVAYFPFSGWKDSFFGDLHGQGFDAINFFTDRKVVISRWF
ncbi:MAG: CoA-acylating methylmalonate-semialdehyde dehydrogenase [Candidatus Bathyarchaeia archaeon]|jgi:malonate-semialdehyde dehydrogenase (acetylating)/methylmalonate-semialdehyde dehydrogenase